jgi:hypothetical protein
MSNPTIAGITFDGDYSVATPQGPPVFEQPFAQDDARYAFKQKFHQYFGPATGANPAPANFSSPARGDAHPDGTNFPNWYFNTQSEPSHLGGGLFEFEREYARQPADRDEFGDVSHSFQYQLYASGVYTLVEIAKLCSSRTRYQYFRIAPSGGDYASPYLIPLFSQNILIKISDTLLVGLGTPYSTAAITGISVANPTHITAVGLKLQNGQWVTIAGSTGGTPSINGNWQVTVLDADHFTIPLNVTSAGSGGTVTPQEILHGDSVLRHWKSNIYELATCWVALQIIA